MCGQCKVWTTYTREKLCVSRLFLHSGAAQPPSPLEGPEAQLHGNLKGKTPHISWVMYVTLFLQFESILDPDYNIIDMQSYMHLFKQMLLSQQIFGEKEIQILIYLGFEPKAF